MLSLEMTTDSLTSSSSRYSMEIDLCLSSVAIAMLSGLGVGAEEENEDLHKKYNHKTHIVHAVYRYAVYTSTCQG